MRETLRRILGGVIVLAGLVGLVTSIYAVVWLQGAAEKAERDIVSGMDFGLESLEVVSDTLQIVIQTVDDTALVVDSAVESSEQASETLQEIQPAVQDLSDIVAFQLPNSVRGIQGTMPALEQAAAAIDATLRTLASFEWSATIPVVNYELGFGLGVDYDPPVPLDESIRQVDLALSELPGQLSDIQASLLDTNRNLGQTAESIQQVGESLATVSEDLRQTSAVLEEYNDLVGRATNKVRDVRWDIRQRVQGVRTVLSVILLWLALSQLAPLYLGSSMLFPAQTDLMVDTSDDREDDESEAAGEEAEEPSCSDGETQEQGNLR